MAEGRHYNAPVAADENGVADLLLQIADGGGQDGLRDKQIVGRAVDRPCFGNLHHILQLIQRHMHNSIHDRSLSLIITVIEIIY